MIITGCFDIIVETNDDVLALEKFLRPVDFDRVDVDADLYDELGFREPEKYPSFVMLGAQGTLLFYPVKVPALKKKPKIRVLKGGTK